MSGTELERDFIVGVTAAQKIPAGGVVTKCKDCGEACLLDAKGVRELGRRSAAVVLCDTCVSKIQLQKAQRQAMDPKKGLGPAPHKTPSGVAVPMPDGTVSLSDFSFDEIQHYFDFDPPSAGDAVQATKVKDLEAPAIRWKWVNDLNLPVLMTRKADGQQTMIMPTDSVDLIVDLPANFQTLQKQLADVLSEKHSKKKPPIVPPAKKGWTVEEMDSVLDEVANTGYAQKKVKKTYKELLDEVAEIAKKAAGKK